MAMGEFDVVTYALIGKKLKSKADLVDGKIPASELPSYVDDVVEYASVDQFPEEGEASKIYVALDTGNTYRWSGSEYIQIGGGSPMVETTYAALKAARDAGTLVPGMQYRITDYQCTTATTNTQSAGHQFDIIVVADDESHLNEFARAALHEGDTYFANCKVTAWKVWYCLDNDTNRFAWAEPAIGKGVIFRLIDEFNNDVCYDFKNIQFKFTDIGNNFHYTFESYPYVSGAYQRCDKSVLNPSINQYICSNNVIRPYLVNNPSYNSNFKMVLNFIVLGGNYRVENNTIDCNCNYIMIPNNNGSSSWIFDNYFAQDCHNIYAYEQRDISLRDNVFMQNCRKFTFGSSTVGLNFNVFGDSCYDFFFNGNDISYNHFMNGCQYIQFKNSYISGNWLDNCRNINFGWFSNYNKLRNCSYVSIGKNVTSSGVTYFTSGCAYNILEGVSNFQLCVSGSPSTSESTWAKYVNVHEGKYGTSSNPYVLTLSPGKECTTNVYKSGSEDIVI